MRIGKKALQELIRSQKNNSLSLNFHSLNERYFLNSSYAVTTEEISNIVDFLKNNVCNFKDIIDKYKNTRNRYGDSYLNRLLSNKECFKKLSEEKLIHPTDLTEIFCQTTTKSELESLYYNSDLLRSLFQNKICSFTEFSNKLSRSSEIVLLRDTTQLFPYLIENKLVTSDELHQFLRNLNSLPVIVELCHNLYLFDYALKNYLITEEVADNYNKLAEPQMIWKSSENIYKYLESTVLEQSEFIEQFIDTQNEEYINYSRETRDSVLKNLQNLHLVRQLPYSEDERREIYTILQDADSPRECLQSIIDGNLQSAYDIGQLKKLLTRHKDKKKLKLNL